MKRFVLCSLVFLPLVSAGFAGGPMGLDHVQEIFVADGHDANIWFSKGWTIVERKGSAMLEASEGGPDASKVFLDVSPLVGTGRAPHTAAKLNGGFLVAGTLEAGDGARSEGFVVLGKDGVVTEVHDMGQYRQGSDATPNAPRRRVVHVTQHDDGSYAMFWHGRIMEDGEDVYIGVTLYDEDWGRIRDLYGPVNMGTYLRGPVSFLDSLCQVRIVRDRFVIVDAHNRRLVIANREGEREADLVVSDPSGERTHLVGWSLSPSGRHVHVLYVTEDDQTSVRRVTYSATGQAKTRGEVEVADGFRTLRPTDTGHGVVISRQRVLRGRMPE